jgi:hypothetical protein
VWVRSFDTRTFVGTHLRAAGPLHFARTAVGSIRRRIRQAARPAASGARIEEISSFDDRADSLWAAVEAQFDVATIRDAAYLNWRYADIRAGRSLILGAFEGERVVGYAVFKRAGANANVLDLVVEPERLDIALELLESGGEQMRAAGVQTLTCWVPAGHPNEATLPAAGYLETGRTVQTGVGPLRRDGVPAGVDLVFSGNARWHWMMGDEDFV